MHGVAHAMFQRFAKAQGVNGAWPVLIDLRGGGLPPGEATFAKVLDDLAEAGQDRITFKVSGAATLIQPSAKAYACRRGRGAVGPAGDAESGSQFSGCCGQPKACSGSVCLSAGRGGEGFGDEPFQSPTEDG